MDDYPKITIHSKEEFKFMRLAGKLAAETLDFITPYVQEGVTTEKLDSLSHNFILDHGAIPAPLNYRGFPKSICTSINHVVCHGIPSDRILKNGDLINIDVTVILNGWHGDTSRMFWVGKPKILSSKLTKITYESMWKGIEAVKPKATLGDIGYAIQEYAESNGYSIVIDFCGHGIGKVFHAPPNVLHYGNPGEGLVLKEGMFFTIEPMVNAGNPEVKILSDGWTAVTRDKSPSAQFEHSLGVTDKGYEVFTKSPLGLDCPPYEINN